jgi:hypothetical protein
MNAKQNWINETENSLNHLNAVDVNPYLYSKIINKLTANDKDIVSSKFVWATSLSIVIVLILNIYAVRFNLKSKSSSTKTEIQSLSSELYLTNIIDYN